ncbi:uncharacterized protein LOC126293725 isoform X1 [Schistocerca gregaria]|uniref:uncharacterized protein LOC126293725 isoform X1 n=1 Tax=Schistocerca gregaria TaxID=7010 RepID=UPI00211E6AC3|nr:uncharacterized protein LOC126293725 isoform X1 [Schistocerca gregaria]XP_049842998.1 uncharacterized protein LOC126293725 isoform X1 [Schistocerca gregaria]XP_049842999.1 uncharacterized protein LOC126293725 isoform X1 [Schistocerca gregaria]XP_049843000.1 uncharacterized protein LOC126293725 isoform X1 [Schistocerca gregaria]XP_049843001.1 uncharacterized protein LOC126293725 isoform X1 [Schistocerca gregaria]
MTTPSNSPQCEGPPDSRMASGCDYRGRRHVPAEGSMMWHTGINDLPDELLLMILSHVAFTDLLDVVPNVCRRWKKLSQDSKLWADREFNIGALWQCYLDDRKGGGNEQEAIEIFRNVPNLCIVRMWFNVNPLVIEELCDHCPRLAELHLHTSQQLTYSVLKTLVEKCTRIHTLTAPYKLLQSERCSEALSQLHNLRVLNLEPEYKEFDRSSTQEPCLVRPLVSGCPQLAEVDFGFTYIDMEDLRYFLRAKRNTLRSIRIKWAMGGMSCVPPLLEACTELERLELCEDDDFEMVHSIPREAFTALGKLKNLQELRISIPIRLPPGVAALAFKGRGLKRLRKLDIWCGPGLDNETIIAISRGLPALRELSLCDAKMLSVVAFSEIYRLEQLEILDVTDCRTLGGALFPYLVGLPRLHTLRMENMAFARLQPGVSSILELSGVRCLTFDYSVVAGVPFEKFPEKLVNLRELGVKECQGDPKAVEGLAEQMPGLKIHGVIRPL